MKKTTFIISAALTIFTLLILAGVAYSVKYSGRAAAAQLQDVQPPAAQDLPQEFAEREAAYQELINQANQRLEQAQAEIQRLQSQSAQTLVLENVSIEQAAQIAASYLGQTEIYSAESNFTGGLPVYRITFSSGDVVLVSASGQILDVQIATQISAFSASSGNDRDEEEHEHEESEHED